jgi:hypothetical protein
MVAATTLAGADMRFYVLVAAAVVGGALPVVALTKLFPDQRASMAASMQAAGAQIAKFRLADLNPLQWDYDYVARQVASPDRKLDFPVGTPVVVDQSKMLSPFGSGQMSVGGGFSNNTYTQPRWHSPPPRR